MSQTQRQDFDRLMDLLAERASGACMAPADFAELEALLRRMPQVRDDAGQVVEAGPAGHSMAHGVGAMAAGLSALGAEQAQVPPDALRRLVVIGSAMVASGATRTANAEIGADPTSEMNRAPASASALGRPVASKPSADERAGVVATIGPARSTESATSWIGWAVAAGLALVAAVGWFVKPPPPVPPPSLAQQRSQILGGSTPLAFAAQNNPAAQGVTGDVAWDNAGQRGVVRVRGLAINDAAARQYQLWVFDKSRADGRPISAGVFDVTQASIDPTTGDVLVPFRASLPVGAPAAFAISAEGPGGAVQPTMSEVLLIAPVSG
ncbi:MAG: anti-sigma factor [Planctomycetota bacterium]|nr:anti-sigma factor [Planctomycetota bacterium]